MTVLPLQWKSLHWRHSYASSTGIILGIGAANEGRRYNVTSSLIGWTHTQKDANQTKTLWTTDADLYSAIISISIAAVIYHQNFLDLSFIPRIDRDPCAMATNTLPVNRQ